MSSLVVSFFLPYLRLMIGTFFDTEKYTLLPYEYHSTGKEKEYLSSLFEIGDGEVKALDVPLYEAAFLYVSPETAGESIPAAFHLLELMGAVPDAHKLLVRFSEGLVTVSLADRDHLLLLCSYPASSFTDSLYYVFAALKEVLFEPDHTSLYWCGSVQDESLPVLERYFEKVIKIDF